LLKSEKLFIAPKVRQELYETSFVPISAQKCITESDAFLIKMEDFNQEVV
jgi:hypothetical protein